MVANKEVTAKELIWGFRAIQNSMVVNFVNNVNFQQPSFRAIQNSMVVNCNSVFTCRITCFRAIQNSMVVNKYYPPNRYRLGWFFV